ncbi:MAG: endonuclease/exonuclease/phosphatase family protein [Sterolibacteriaceae bacterium]|uniref:Endonuclease/exonuclease/phosphatase family protein n=1 Tax=Candidatus Methylophosphatis roskildensis TaxID=2899263 RepID=A0A9D7DVR6_9PROT|nr:endonuclease/exonuclease/phosphatase family protein [Candidatus Methylophosphatis roskildensis]
MEAIELLHARNTISRHKQRLQQELVFVMLVENIAFDKLVEVHWAGEDKVWHVLRAEYQGFGGTNHEVWRAHVTLHPSEDASLPGDVEFALRYRVQSKEYWDKNESRNYFSNADSGVLLEHNASLLNADFNPILQAGQRHYPITVAVRHSLQPKRVDIHWTTDNWRSTQVTPCFFRRMHWDRTLRSGARNPNRYDTSIWIGQLKVDDAFRVQYALACETPRRTIWDNNFDQNYVAHRQRLKILTLNLHCYQEEDQDAKFSQIARAIDELDIDLVCLQEVAENWCDGEGDWNSNAARIIRDRLRRRYHLHTDWSHLGFDRYREGLAILSKYDFRMTDSGYVSPSHDAYSINSRKVVMVQVDVPYMGVVNLFSAHLSWLSGGFLEQFEYLRSWANEKHGQHLAATFLCGDFNIKAGAEGYQAVVQTREYEDQYLAATSRNVFEKIFRKQSPNIDRHLAKDGRIDYIFMQKHSSLQAVAARELFTSGDRYGRVSDHTGYCVEFEPNW